MEKYAYAILKVVDSEYLGTEIIAVSLDFDTAQKELDELNAAHMLGFEETRDDKGNIICQYWNGIYKLYSIEIVPLV